MLATLPAEAGAMPVLAVQPLDRGRTAVFTADTTRKWQQGPRALDRESPFVRFWGQMVRWLAGRTETVEAQASVVAATDKAAYEPGETVHITAVVRDKQGQGAGRRQRGGQRERAAGKCRAGHPFRVPGPAGHYAGAVEPRAAGSYEVVVEARLGELSLTAEKVTVEVGRPNLEFERLDLDEKTLAAIAAADRRPLRPHFGRRSPHRATRPSQRKKTVFVEQRLYWPPGFWALFVGILTTEWVLRTEVSTDDND